jgi:hypothetical protein
MDHAGNAIDFVLSSGLAVLNGATAWKACNQGWAQYEIIRDLDIDDADVQVGWTGTEYDDRDARTVKYQAAASFAIGVAASIVSAGFAARAGSVVNKYI